MSAVQPPDQLGPASHIYFSERLRLHYVDWGNAEQPGMVFVHGIHDHCRTWDQLAAAYAADWHVVAPDLRGHGDSEWVRGSSYHYLDYLYDLHQLIIRADLAPVTLVGHSMGGAIASFFAGAFPELVHRLVIIEGIGLWREMQPPKTAQEKIREWVEATQALAGRMPRRYPTLNDAYTRMQRANPELSDAQAYHLTVHGANQNEDGTFSWKYDNYTHNFSSSGVTEQDMRALWANIACPVLIINAEHGLEHRIGHDGTIDCFRSVSQAEIEGAGHWTYHDDPARIAALIDDFLTG